MKKTLIITALLSLIAVGLMENVHDRSPKFHGEGRKTLNTDRSIADALTQPTPSLFTQAKPAVKGFAQPSCEDPDK
jgi:hypothetical protein